MAKRIAKQIRFLKRVNGMGPREVATTTCHGYPWANFGFSLALGVRITFPRIPKREQPMHIDRRPPSVFRLGMLLGCLVAAGGLLHPTLARWPGKIPAGGKSHDILRTLDLMPTFAKLAGVDMPTVDRTGKPTVFDGYDMDPVLFGTDKSERKAWFYFTEDELSPGAVRIGQFKAVFKLRGDDGAQTGGLTVDSNLGWKGARSYLATVPQIFDLWADPQERYDLFMNNLTEKTWFLPTIQDLTSEFMKSYVANPPRKQQSDGYT